MNRRGFVLLSVVWVLVLGSGLALAALEQARAASRTAYNRSQLTRAEWARRACESLLESRPVKERHRNLTTVQVGGSAWCRYRIEVPERHLNVNLTSRPFLHALLQSDSVTDAVLDWIDEDTLPRPYGAERDWYRTARRRPPADGPVIDLRDLLAVRGVTGEHLTRLERAFTTRGDGRLLVLESPAEVWRLLPGLGEPGARRLSLMRRLNALPGDPDALRAMAASLAGRSAGLESLWLASEPSLLVVHYEGGWGSSRLTSKAVVEYAVSGGRLARAAVEVLD